MATVQRKGHISSLLKILRKNLEIYCGCGTRHLNTLKNGVGGWVDGEAEKQEFITNYFMHLFTSNVAGDVSKLYVLSKPG